MPKRGGKGGGAKKYGRDKVKCARYRNEGREEKNKTRHIAKQKRFEAKKKAKRERGSEA